jgi:hypothetical protein
MNKELPELVNTGKGFTVKYKGKYLYSNIDPVGKIKKLISQLIIQDKTLIFIPCLGLGYGLKMLLKKLPPHCFVICVEADEKLMSLNLKHGEGKDLKHKRLVLVQSQNVAAIIKALHSLGIQNVRRVQRLILCGGYSLFQDTYDLMQQALEKEIKTYWQNRITLLFLGRLLVKNIFANLPSLITAHDLKYLKTEVPIVVVGAGPSLDATIPLLKEIQEKVFILATDTALGTLLAYSLVPDLIFSLEAQFFNIQDFILDQSINIPILCDLSVTPQVLRLFKAAYFFSSQFYNLEILERLKQHNLLPVTIPPLGSVGIAAVYCALQITNAPVLLAGLDFSFGGKKTHAKNTIFHKLMLINSERFCPSEQINFKALLKRPLLSLNDKTGKPILSDLIFHSYLESLSRLISLYPERVYDLSPLGIASGAKPGHDLSLLKDLLPNYEKENSRLVDRQIPPEAAGYSPNSLVQFFNEEEKLLKEALEITYSLLKEKKRDSGVLDGSSFAKLKAVDYTYFHLPHNISLPRYTRSFLQHIQAFCRYYLTKVKQVKKVAGTN